MKWPLYALKVEEVVSDSVCFANYLGKARIEAKPSKRRLGAECPAHSQRGGTWSASCRTRIIACNKTQLLSAHFKAPPIFCSVHAPSILLRFLRSEYAVVVAIRIDLFFGPLIWYPPQVCCYLPMKMHDDTEGLPIVSDDSSFSLNYSTTASPYLAYFTEPHTSVSIPESSLTPVDGLRSNAAAYVDEEELPEWCNVLSLECECHISYQFYDYEEVLLLGLVTLPIIIFGLCANLTSIRIFTHRLMISSSINWYLGVLSCSDTFILFSAFFVLSLPRIGEYTGIWIATSCRWAFQIFLMLVD